MNKCLVEELELDLESALYKDPLIARELEFKLEQNPNFLDWWGGEPANDFLFNALGKAAIANDYGEYDNYDFIVRSGWSKQKGIGKSSVVVSFKNFYDTVITENGFCMDEIFYTITEKIDYLKKNAGKLNNRFFVLDEMVPLIGQSSTADTLRMLRLDDTTRIRGFNNCYVSPRGEAMFSHDYYLDVVLKDVKHKTIVCCLRARDGTALGWVGFPRPKYNIWKKYQKRKKEFLVQLESGAIRKMQFKTVYEKLQEEFDIEGRYKHEVKYYTELTVWRESGEKKGKPIRPKVPLSPSRIRNLLVAINPEMTNQELDTGSEVIYAMLEKKFKGGD